ncbi:conserved hypothetical protein [Leptospira interrogans serovar Manilae]|uniref:Uncharacterized protein n=1 Tax=Leptospira interrogans serovar Manilae TaxID=214675 RepID=A0AAQ1P2P2_LEPIR|nr:conserved hypothetical protein [Leptospira interrogans serovar Manilae]
MTISPRWGSSIRISSDSVNGIRIEYLILFTNKKSPIFKVGIIDPDGILFASKTEDLKANTRITIRIKENVELMGDSCPAEDSFVLTSDSNFIGKAKRIFSPLSILR